MQLKPFYTYDEVARLEVVTVGTLTTWISRDRQLPDNERRFPGAFGGLIPLADVKARYGLTNDDVKAMDLPDPAPRRVATAP